MLAGTVAQCATLPWPSPTNCEPNTFADDAIPFERGVADRPTSLSPMLQVEQRSVAAPEPAMCAIAGQGAPRIDTIAIDQWFAWDPRVASNRS